MIAHRHFRASGNPASLDSAEVKSPGPHLISAAAEEFPAEDGSARECRAGCGACCIAPSISSPIPGMPHGKPAGVRCIQLDDANRCRLFGKPGRPEICVRLRPQVSMCGTTRDEALRILAELENATR